MLRRSVHGDGHPLQELRQKMTELMHESFPKALD
jgi:hypothetical protein